MMTIFLTELIITAILLGLSFGPFFHELGKDGFGDKNFKWFVDYCHILYETDIVKSFLLFVAVALYISLLAVTILEIIYHV